MNWRIAKMEDELRHHNEELRADGETDQPIRSMVGTDVRRSSLITSNTMSSISMISSWSTSISTMSISRTINRPTSSSPVTSWIVSDAAITSPAVSDKGVEDSMDGTVKDGGGFSEVLEETTESDVTWRTTQRWTK